MSFHFITQRLSEKEIALFFRQLATLTKANIPLLQCCYILLPTQKNTSLKTVILTIMQNLKSGLGLAVSLKHFPRWFNYFICQLIDNAEITGTLPYALSEIANICEKNIAYQHKLRQILFYPVMVLVIASLISLTLILEIVPRFSDFFHSVPNQLPWITIQLINLSNLLRQNTLIIVCMMACLVGFGYCLKQHPVVNTILINRIRRLPLIHTFFTLRAVRRG